MIGGEIRGQAGSGMPRFRAGIDRFGFRVIKFHDKGTRTGPPLL
jgi:hypothetical protein